jgi:glycosyltransferase involved in cell wall biosynthesis
LKILAINWQDLRNPQAGGAEVHLQEILKRIAARGNEITLLCSSFDGAPEEEEIDGVRIVRKGWRHNFNLILPFVLKSILKREKYDIVVEDINKIPFYSPLFHNLPLLVVIPHLFATTVFKEINFTLGLYIYFSEKPLTCVYRHQKFMVISESTKDDLARRGIRKENIFVVKCGIDHQLYKRGGEKYSFPAIAYIGRIKKYKSIQHLILAFRLVLERLPDSKLFIIGEGDYLPHLKKLSKRLGLEDKIEFTGYVSQEEKVERLQSSHLVVCPSLKEGWGLTNVEANACGTPVIASNVPGLKDSVVDGKTGLLFRYGDIEDLAKKIVNVLSNKSIEDKLIQGGLEWARNFSWDEAAGQTLNLVNLTLNKK